MNDLRQLLEEFLNRELVMMILSNSRDTERGSKVKIRPVLLKEELFFQETLYRGAQVFHENFRADEMVKRIERYLETLFKQCECKAPGWEATVLVSKKGKMTIKRRRVAGTQDAAKREGADAENREQALSHNRKKTYILQEGRPVDFLIGLGVQTPDGRVAKAKYDKFRQINRYLEFIEDVLEHLPKDRTIKIIDFGCGKSYLTFAMYYYLHELQHRDIEVIGLDLKKDVIEHCNKLAEELHYDCLRFERGDISTYEGAEGVDMVVSLHACDTATDYALEKAICWGAEVIMAVPCCQHEVNRQIHCDSLQPILKYGLLKERLSALVTDAVRANLLEQNGYDTQILEFIDMEHTPKNLLIRAVKRGKMQTAGSKKRFDEMTEFLQISTTLERLLEDKVN
ncbi:MAG: SAM-dependent methyltransferase [Lachnospiraceae bacterium]|nr:SAM-dependent methyltransferase [Lachnospiraceae bacterium]